MTDAVKRLSAAPDGQRFVMVRGGTAASTLVAVHHAFDRLVHDRGRVR